MKKNNKKSIKLKKTLEELIEDLEKALESEKKDDDDDDDDTFVYGRWYQ